MADTDILPPDNSPHADASLRPAEEALHLTGEIKEEGVFASLVSSFRDVFFPAKLPPLVLESQPVAVVDKMAVKRSPTSTAAAVVLHGLIFAFIIWLVAKKVQVFAPAKPTVSLVDLSVPVPPPPMPKASQMGGGGGQHALSPV